AERARRRIEQFNTLADSSRSLTASEHNATVRQQRGGVARSRFYKRCWYRGPRIRGRLIDFGGAEKFAARRDAASYKNAALCQVDFIETPLSLPNETSKDHGCGHYELAAKTLPAILVPGNAKWPSLLV